MALSLIVVDTPPLFSQTNLGRADIQSLKWTTLNELVGRRILEINGINRATTSKCPKYENYRYPQHNAPLSVLSVP